MNNTEKIEKFIQDNNLDFSGTGSDLNGNCVILAGYACYLGLDIEDMENIVDKLDILHDTTPDSPWDEFTRVFEYAYENDYGEAWNTDEYKKMYKY